MKFQESYLRLNERQKQAVDHIYGPMLCLAGAGTGKTQVLSTRVTRLIQSEAQISPDNILCLTYTDAGAKAMRKRLVEMIGPAAYRTTINTFHGFCSDIIKYNMDYFGFRDLEAIDELENVRIIYDMINKLPNDNPIKRLKGDPYFEVYRLKNLFSFMKEEGWDKGSIEAACNNWYNPLKTLAFEGGKLRIKHQSDPDTYKEMMFAMAQELDLMDFVYKKGNKSKDIIAGDPKYDKIQDEEDRCKLIIAAAQLFDPYQKIMRGQNRYDFSDMIHWVINAFRSSNGEWLLQQYQEKFQFVLIDEMQDTSGPQMELINLLMGYWEEPNIFAVGDIDQTLYNFSGARIQNIMDYVSKYNPIVVSLNENYRSAQQILDAAKSVISNNVIRLSGVVDIDDPSNLTSKTGLKSFPICLECKNILEEESMIVDVIAVKIQSGVKPDDIAVLYRKHKQADNIIKMLAAMDIPVNARKRVNVLQEPIIRQLLSILRYCSDHHNLGEDRKDLMYEILHYPYMGEFDHITINKFIKTEDPQNVTLSKLTTLVYTESIPEVISSAITNTGMLKYITSHPQSRELLVYLSTFMEWAKSYCFKNPFAEMVDMLNDIDKMVDRDIPLTCQDIYVGESGVTFSTVHGAKGLEWEHVILIGCTSNEWEKARGRTDTYRLPETITVSKGDDELESARRLFYVALTRAKLGLMITYSAKNNDGKELEATRFIAESGITIDQMSMTQDSGKFYDRLSGLLSKTQPVLTIRDESYLRELVDSYTLSPTAVNKFMKCPLTWYFENLIRVPFVATGALVFGNAFHYAMKMFYDKSRHESVTCDQVMEWFNQDMRRHQGQIGAEEWFRRSALGSKLIPVYYEKVMISSNKFTLNEFKAHGITLPNGVPFKGDIDKIEFEGNMVDIVDYKTGSYTYVKSELKAPGDDFEGGGWRQLMCYSLIVDHGVKSKPWKTRSLRVEMIDVDFMGPILIQFTPEDQKLVLDQIKKVYDHIQALDFLTGCGDPDCKWCSFIKNDVI